MFPIQSPMSVTTKASLEANFALYASLTSKTLETVEKLVNLNMSAVRASLEESAVAARKMLSAEDAEDILSVVREQAKPNMSKAIAYGGNLFAIANDLQSEFSGAAEAQIAAASRKVNELVEQSLNSTPVGSDAVMTAFKSAFGNTGNGVEQLTRSTKQAMEMLEASMSSTFNQFAQVAAPAKA